jgi:hypothetical protein
MADLEKVSAQIEGIEARIVKALDAGERVLEFDKQLKEAREEQAVALKAAHDAGAKISEELSKRIEAQERRLGALSATGVAPADNGEPKAKSFGGQVTDWLSDPNIRERAKSGRQTTRLALAGGTLRNHLAAVEALKALNMPATDENVQKTMLTSDATNFAPVNRFPNVLPLHGRKRVMRDLLPSRNLGVGSAWEYLEYMGSGADTPLTATSIGSTGLVATLTYTAHGARVGDRIQVYGSSDTDYNGYFNVVSVPTADTLTYNMLADPGDDTADGTIYFRNLSTWAGAASVAENTLKPESKLLPRSVTGVVELIAHIFRVSKQALDDVIGLQSDINTMGIRGLAELEEYKFLYGDGTSSTILGILASPAIQSYSQAVTGSVGRFSMMRHGVTMLENVGAMPSAAIINPNDHETFETSVGLDDHWMLPAGSDGGSNQLWRVPLVSTRSIAPGTILMGDFQEGAYIVDRESPNVSFADQDGDDFKYNRLAIRFEERLGLAIPRPEFFVNLSLTS